MPFKYNIPYIEKQYQNQIDKAINEITSNSSIKFILVAGPSCSGKTTTTKKLIEGLSKKGISAHMISIDDFFFDVDSFDKDKDFESLESIDMEYFHECLKNLADGNEVSLPLFDFITAKRSEKYTNLKLDENSIAIIEGLHALNPEIYENFVDEGKIYKIFLDCRNNKLPENLKKYPRLVRRLVRDFNFRNADANLTFLLWEKVILGEEKYIYPFKDNAHIKINTFFEYELSVLKRFARSICEQMPKESEYFEDNLRLLDYLNTESQECEPKSVPKDSLLREFIG